MGLPKMWEKKKFSPTILVMPLLKLWRKKNFFFPTISVMPFPKLWRKKNFFFPYFGNAITEIVGEKKSGSGIAEIGREKKNLWQTNCGNGITEIGKKVRILFFQYFFDWTSLICHVLLEIDKDRFKYTGILNLFLKCTL